MNNSGHVSIPIVLLSHNNNSVFEDSLCSILKNTRHPFDVYVVDNSSSDIFHKEYLRHLHKNKVIKLFENDTNNFILGLNKALSTIESRSGYIAVCDSDFLYPEPVEGVCWLESLYNEMEKSPYIGKLGISIMLDNIANKKNLENIYKRELSFSEVSLNDNVWAAQVDTTPALYRTDFFFWGKFRFYPGHMSANKPHYYIGRHKLIKGYHLGWDLQDYLTGSEFSISVTKVLSFAMYGGALDESALSSISKHLKITYYILRYASKLLWSSHKLFFFILFLVKSKLYFGNKVIYK